jgi:hypothetical protein
VCVCVCLCVFVYALWKYSTHIRFLQPIIELIYSISPVNPGFVNREVSHTYGFIVCYL